MVISPELADVLADHRRRASATHRRQSRWSPPTTTTNASGTRRCRCCSNGDAGFDHRAVSETVLRTYLDRGC